LFAHGHVPGAGYDTTALSLEASGDRLLRALEERGLPQAR
jgi:hypothetical protein